LSLLKTLRSSVIKSKTLLTWKEEYGNKELVKSAGDLFNTSADEQEEDEQLEDEEEDYEEQDYSDE
jgi:hypothetical protein